MNEKKFYLEPADSRKSFYKKCYVTLDGKDAILFSYDTIICIYDTENKKLYTAPEFNYSATTKRHQNAFFKFYDITPDIIKNATKLCDRNEAKNDLTGLANRILNTDFYGIRDSYDGAAEDIPGAIAEDLKDVKKCQDIISYLLDIIEEANT